MKINVTLAIDDKTETFAALQTTSIFTTMVGDTKVFMKKMDRNTALSLSTLEIHHIDYPDKMNVELIERLARVRVDYDTLVFERLDIGDFFRMVSGNIVYRKISDDQVLNIRSLEIDNMPLDQTVGIVDPTLINVLLK